MAIPVVSLEHREASSRLITVDGGYHLQVTVKSGVLALSVLIDANRARDNITREWSLPLLA